MDNIKDYLSTMQDIKKHWKVNSFLNTIEKIKKNPSWFTTWMFNWYKNSISTWINNFKKMTKIHYIILFIFFYWLIWILFSNISALESYNYNYIWIILKLIIAWLLTSPKILNMFINIFK